MSKAGEDRGEEEAEPLTIASDTQVITVQNPDSCVALLCIALLGLCFALL